MTCTHTNMPLCTYIEKCKCTGDHTAILHVHKRLATKCACALEKVSSTKGTLGRRYRVRMHNWAPAPCAHAQPRNKQSRRVCVDWSRNEN